MNLDKTNGYMPATIRSSAFTDKNASEANTSFKGKEPENTDSGELQRVPGSVARASLGIKEPINTDKSTEEKVCARDVLPRDTEFELLTWGADNDCWPKFDGNMVIFTHTDDIRGKAVRYVEVDKNGKIVKDVSGKDLHALYPHPDGTKEEVLEGLSERYGKAYKTESLCSDDAYTIFDKEYRTKIHVAFDGDKIVHENQYEFDKDTGKVKKLVEFDKGKLYAVTEYYWGEEPQYSVKYKAENEKAEVWMLDDDGHVTQDILMTPEEYHERFGRELPSEEALSKNSED